MNTKTNLKILSTIFSLLLCCNISQAMFTILSEVPVDRLIANATAYIQEHPDDVNGIYVLGRIHYLAFSLKTLKINGHIFEDEKTYLPRIEENWKFDFIKRMVTQKLTKEELGFDTGPGTTKEQRIKYEEMYQKKQKEVNLLDWNTIMYIDSNYKNYLKPNKILDSNELFLHAEEAMKYFRKALDMAPENGLYYLGYASLLEQYVNFLKEKDMKEIPEELRNIILEKSKDLYYLAFSFSIEDDLKSKEMIAWALPNLIAYESGISYIRLTESNVSNSEAEQKKINEIKENLPKLKKKGLKIITPIIFSLETRLSPADLLEKDLQVNFDLNGDGAAELWPWVKPSTGILVWNEDGKGQITSGKQMFGSVTWWLFFNDGYHALDCLDDNRDGTLSGSELAGISVWFDTNSNGKSEPGEIKSLDELGIISISTKSTSTENGWPANKTGIKLTTSKTIPTYDWIASQKP